MHFFTILHLSIISVIVPSISTSSSPSPPALSIINDPIHPPVDLGRGVNHNGIPHVSHKRTRSGGLATTNYWGNGWTSHSYLYAALIPLPAASAMLSSFYTRLFVQASNQPQGLTASFPSLIHGLVGHTLRFQSGALVLQLFSMNTVIPWSFVTAVAAKLRADTMMGLTGFHGTTFVHETNLKIFVTVTAEGFMLPATAL